MQKFCSRFLCPLTPPPPRNQQSDGFPLEFLPQGPQKQNCEHPANKPSEKIVRTNRIMNKRAFLKKAGKSPKKTKIFILAETLKSFGKKKKARKSKNGKEKNLRLCFEQIVWANRPSSRKHYDRPQDRFCRPNPELGLDR